MVAEVFIGITVHRFGGEVAAKGRDYVGLVVHPGDFVGTGFPI